MLWQDLMLDSGLSSFGLSTHLHLMYKLHLSSTAPRPSPLEAPSVGQAPPVRAGPERQPPLGLGPWLAATPGLSLPALAVILFVGSFPLHLGLGLLPQLDTGPKGVPAPCHGSEYSPPRLVEAPPPPMKRRRSSWVKASLTEETNLPSKPDLPAGLEGSCACCRIFAMCHSLRSFLTQSPALMLEAFASCLSRRVDAPILRGVSSLTSSSFARSSMPLMACSHTELVAKGQTGALFLLLAEGA